MSDIEDIIICHVEFEYRVRFVNFTTKHVTISCDSYIFTLIIVYALYYSVRLG